MAWLRRALNVFRRNRVSREIDEELESHVQDAIEFGRDPAEARLALGHPLRLREESRDVKLLSWLESLLADAQFGLRQLTKNPVTSAAAILSLALAIGACGAAFRIADAMLWRPLPIRVADRLFLLSREGGSMPMGFQIIGVVRNIRYRHLRDPELPLAYVPFQSMDVNGAWRPASRGNFAVKVRSNDPLQIVPSIRRALAESRSGFRVDTIRTQDQLIDADVVRERLLAMLGLFFGAVALLVAGIGLYGVLHYSVLQRRREIGVRLALGAHAFEIARIVTTDAVAMVLAGSLAGIALGLGAARYLQVLFFEVSATDPAMLAIPFCAIAAATLLAITPPVVRALQIDPRIMLRAE